MSASAKPDAAKNVFPTRTTSGPRHSAAFGCLRLRPFGRSPGGQAALLVLGLALFTGISGCIRPTPPAPADTPDHYLFCFWNVENLFDDHPDEHTQAADKEFDRWFARDPAALRLKLDHLSQALIALNGGRGPDIIAVAEVESLRAAELLRDALNAHLEGRAPPYDHVLMKELNAGRHIAPAIITRLRVQGDRTRLHGHRQRILEAHIDAGGQDLIVIATHWTSRVSDKEGHQRGKYGDLIYGLFRGMWMKNPAVKLLVCGDFNDPPDAPSITEHLRATGDLAAVRRANPPLLFDLFAGKNALEFGTHHFGSSWMIFDQIIVSPGMLDPPGWTCEPATVRTINTLVRPADRQRRPWRFGNERDQFPRGYSDHFPVTVELRVTGG